MLNTPYYLGLDMGTNSVGWAVTDKNYNLLRAKGKDLILSILVDTFISKISFPMQPGPEIGSISDA